MKVRRCMSVFFEPRETTRFDLGSLLSGGNGLVQTRCWYALAPQLAGELAARAAKNITPQQIAELEGILQQHQDAITKGDTDRIASLGHAFHRKINLTADSPRLARLLGSVVANLPNRFYATIEGHITTTQEEHPVLLEALRKRAGKRAKALMESHILDGAEHLIEELEQRGLWDADDEANAG